MSRDLSTACMSRDIAHHGGGNQQINEAIALLVYMNKYLYCKTAYPSANFNGNSDTYTSGRTSQQQVKLLIRGYRLTAQANYTG
ncbi:MAG: hypothetical protein PHR94_02130 [Methylomonas lenta]|jgi:hypothetical protein|nr:hypothetical protein [Methylomonas lenta]